LLTPGFVQEPSHPTTRSENTTEFSPEAHPEHPRAPRLGAGLGGSAGTADTDLDAAERGRLASLLSFRLKNKGAASTRDASEPRCERDWLALDGFLSRVDACIERARARGDYPTKWPPLSERERARADAEHRLERAATLGSSRWLNLAQSISAAASVTMERSERHSAADKIATAWRATRHSLTRSAARIVGPACLLSLLGRPRRAQNAAATRPAERWNPWELFQPGGDIESSPALGAGRWHRLAFDIALRAWHEARPSALHRLVRSVLFDLVDAPAVAAGGDASPALLMCVAVRLLLTFN
jgi:hypothetical protein